MIGFAPKTISSRASSRYTEESYIWSGFGRSVAAVPTVSRLSHDRET